MSFLPLGNRINDILSSVHAKKITFDAIAKNLLFLLPETKEARFVLRRGGGGGGVVKARSSPLLFHGPLNFATYSTANFCF